MGPLLSLTSNIIIKLIRIYQYMFSPLLNFHCRFQPTCSQYGIEAICKYGLLKGNWLILKRILKCHPWSKREEELTHLKHNNKREEH